MRRFITLILAILISVIGVFGQTNSKHVKVKGYYRKDGTYVQPHYRTAPNSTNRDNFSTKGNVNPYTGKAGYITPDSKSYNYPNNTNSTTKSNSNNSYNYYNSSSSSYNNYSYSLYKDKPTYTTKSRANVREHMNTSSAIKMTVPSNSDVKVVNSFFGDWWEIYYDGKTGYMHSSLLKRSSSTTSTSSSSSYNNYSYSLYKDKPTYTTKSRANVREHMNTSSAIKMTVPSNSDVKVVNSFFGDWWEIFYDGKTGYMHSSLLKRSSSSTSTSSSYNKYSYSLYKDKPTYTTKSRANVREHMNTSSAIKMTVPSNSDVKVVNSFFGDWWEIYYDGKTGYMHSSLLKRK